MKAIKLITSLKFITIIILYTKLLYPQILEPEEIFAKANESVVAIIAYDVEDIKMSQGSGVIIDTGFVVTNFHVYQGSDKMRVFHLGKDYEVIRIIGVDIERDIIVCQTDNTLLPLEIDASNEFRIGERIYAIGSPLGYENSITEGLISGLRKIDDNNLIQISAPISFGSSGGAVVNSRGKLIGISTSGHLYSDINFAIPIEAIYDLATNCSVNDTICSIKINYFLKCYQEYIKLNYKESFVQLNNYIAVDLGENIQPELENVFKIITLDLLFEVDYTITQLNSVKRLFRRDENFVTALGNIDLLLNGEEFNALNNFLMISKKEPNDPNYYYCLGRCYEKMGDKKTQLSHFYKKAFFLGRKDLGFTLYKQGIITEQQWEQFR